MAMVTTLGVMSRPTQLILITSRTMSSSSSTSSVDVDRLSRSARLAGQRRGGGYRSSFSGHVATVFGASGMLGRSVCNFLGKKGTQMVLPYRGDHYHMMPLKLMGDLGQIVFTPYQMKDEESVRKAMRYSDVVINCAGADFPTRNFSLKDINVTIPGMLARLARESGVKTFIHVSHINAREEPPRLFLPNGSEFLRTKWQGEQAVLDEFPDATIFRPVDIIGERGVFLEQHMGVFRRGWGKRVPLWRRGETTVKAPVHKADVAKAIANAVDDPNAIGTIYEAYGPERYLFSELMDFMHQLTNKTMYTWNYKRTDLRLSPVAFAKAFFCQSMPIGLKKYFNSVTIERLERSSLSDEILGLPNLNDLGVSPMPLEKYIRTELQMFKIMHYWEPAPFESYPEVIPPRALSRLEERGVREKATQFSLALPLMS